MAANVSCIGLLVEIVLHVRRHRASGEVEWQAKPTDQLFHETNMNLRNYGENKLTPTNGQYILLANVAVVGV